MFGFFNYKRLDEIAQTQSDVYVNAQPFPHIVIDDVADKYLLNDALNVFPNPKELEWWKYGNVFEKKLAFDKVHELDEDLQKLLCELNSSKFVQFLEQLTGIKNLIADPHYTGGGLHQIENGGLLKLHADFNFNARLQLHRRLNVLLYLNKDWKEEYGGQLELWDKDVTKCYNSIVPLFNRMVIFSTTDGSIHGHPTPLSVPDGVTRKSVALYYYTAERPKEEISNPHSTLYKFKPDEQVTDELKQLQEKRSKGRI
jgi:hypothetical protein